MFPQRRAIRPPAGRRPATACPTTKTGRVARCRTVQAASTRSKESCHLSLSLSHQSLSCVFCAYEQGMRLPAVPTLRLPSGPHRRPSRRGQDLKSDKFIYWFPRRPENDHRLYKLPNRIRTRSRCCSSISTAVGTSGNLGVVLLLWASASMPLSLSFFFGARVPYCRANIP